MPDADSIRYEVVNNSGRKIVRIFPSDVYQRPLPLGDIHAILRQEFPDVPIEKLRMVAHQNFPPGFSILPGYIPPIVMDFRV